MRLQAATTRVAADDELAAQHRRLLTALDLDPADVVLDVGCGSGQTTRDAARLAPRGSALGIDASTLSIARTRELTAVQGPDNATFGVGDAQTCDFASERFDVAISRFGTMFFTDPVAAFTNICSALRAHGLVTARKDAHP